MDTSACSSSEMLLNSRSCQRFAQKSDLMSFISGFCLGFSLAGGAGGAMPGSFSTADIAMGKNFSLDPVSAQRNSSSAAIHSWSRKNSAATCPPDSARPFSTANWKTWRYIRPSNRSEASTFRPSGRPSWWSLPRSLDICARNLSRALEMCSAKRSQSATSKVTYERLSMGICLSITSWRRSAFTTSCISCRVCRFWPSHIVRVCFAKRTVMKERTKEASSTSLPDRSANLARAAQTPPSSSSSSSSPCSAFPAAAAAAVLRISARSRLCAEPASVVARFLVACQKREVLSPFWPLSGDSSEAWQSASCLSCESFSKKRRSAGKLLRTLLKALCWITRQSQNSSARTVAVLWCRAPCMNIAISPNTLPSSSVATFSDLSLTSTSTEPLCKKYIWSPKLPSSMMTSPAW
mmetsp:Transcript_65897/g.192772  ORF Transcript_65897/g.192772 Transcript_65897/m.192772 type:complete len:408 (-) Transcript_65897:54-1277(-)